MSTIIYTSHGTIRRQSRNLRAIAAQNTFGFVHREWDKKMTVIAIDNRILHITWPNGDHCKVEFADPVVLDEFVKNNKYLRFARVCDFC